MFIFRFHLSFVSYLESPGDNPFVPQTNLILQLFPAIRNIYQQQIGSLIQKKLHSHPNCLIYHDIRKIFSSSDKCTKVPCRCSRGINNIFQYCKKNIYNRCSAALWRMYLKCFWTSQTNITPSRPLIITVII